jgi:hypothetical protein
MVAAVVEGMVAAGHQVQHIGYRQASMLQVVEQVEGEPAVVVEAKPGGVVDAQEPGFAGVVDLGTKAKSIRTRSQK